MRNSRIGRENDACFFNLMCEKAHRAALTLSLVTAIGYWEYGKALESMRGDHAVFSLLCGKYWSNLHIVSKKKFCLDP